MRVTGRNLIIALTVFWSFMVGAGTVWMTDYASRPGQSAISPGRLPSSILGEPESSRPMLLIFLHPHCVCGRATLAELSQIIAEDQGMADVRIFFYQPADEPREWIESDIWRQASNMEGVSLTTIGDDGLKEFGTVTSGQALLYNMAGKLVFSGGITAARGHEGNNAGLESIESFLQTGKTDVAETLVFGCSLSTVD